MTKKRAVPEVRFKGFEGEWEERKLVDDLVSIQTGTNLLGTPSNTGTPLLKMGNIQRGYFSLEKIEFLSATQTVEPENIAYYGDFFFNTRNTLDLVGKGATWAGSDGKYAFNNNIARFVFNGLDTFFFNYLYNTQTMIKQVRSRAMGTTSVAAIYPQSLNSLEYKLPDNKEQTRIGALFRNLDARITLEQRKHEKLQNIKKAMLEKMFPKPGAAVPEVRFQGFEGEWEEENFSEIFTYIPNNTLSRACLNYSGGHVKNIHYGDVLIKYDELLDVQKCEIPYISNDINTNKFKSSALQNGDIIIADAAEDETVGKCTEIVNLLNETVVSGLHTIPCRPRHFFASGYLGYFMNSLAYRKQLMHLMQGSKVKSLSKSSLHSTAIFYPNDKYNTEQTRIGEFLRNLDTLITLQQRKCEKLQNIKKAMLGKMFV